MSPDMPPGSSVPKKVGLLVNHEPRLALQSLRTPWAQGHASAPGRGVLVRGEAGGSRSAGHCQEGSHRLQPSRFPAESSAFIGQQLSFSVNGASEGALRRPSQK